MSDYIHGYSDKEQSRLVSQNEVLSKYIYDRIDLSGIRHLAEFGCGVGAQMIYLLWHYPDLKITGIDISQAQIDAAKINLEKAGIPKSRYNLICADIFVDQLDLDVEALLMVWVLEHIKKPVDTLIRLREILPPDSQIIMTEVYHSGLRISPYPDHIMEVWRETIRLQYEMRMDANIGLSLGNYLTDAGYEDIDIRPYPMFWDKTTPIARREKFDYWEGLVRSGFDTLVEHGIMEENYWDRVREEFDSLRSNEDAVFYYSFIQAFANT